MTKQTNSRSFRLLTLGGAKARTNDASGGNDRELDKSRYTAA
jgi:hypothetical protein